MFANTAVASASWQAREVLPVAGGWGASSPANSQWVSWTMVMSHATLFHPKIHCESDDGGTLCRPQQAPLHASTITTILLPQVCLQAVPNHSKQGSTDQQQQQHKKLDSSVTKKPAAAAGAAGTPAAKRRSSDGGAKAAPAAKKQHHENGSEKRPQVKPEQDGKQPAQKPAAKKPPAAKPAAAAANGAVKEEKPAAKKGVAAAKKQGTQESKEPRTQRKYELPGQTRETPDEVRNSNGQLSSCSHGSMPWWAALHQQTYPKLLSGCTAGSSSMTKLDSSQQGLCGCIWLEALPRCAACLYQCRSEPCEHARQDRGSVQGMWQLVALMFPLPVCRATHCASSTPRC